MKIEKLKAPLFRGPEGAGATNDWCITSCLSAIKNHWIKYCEKTYEREGIHYFWSTKNSTEIFNKLKTKGFQASDISTYDFSTLYTTLPHNSIRNQLVDLTENTFRREEALYLACNEEHAFFRFRRT